MGLKLDDDLYWCMVERYWILQRLLHLKLKDKSVMSCSPAAGPGGRFPIGSHRGDVCPLTPLPDSFGIINHSINHLKPDFSHVLGYVCLTVARAKK